MHTRLTTKLQVHKLDTRKNNGENEAGYCMNREQMPPCKGADHREFNILIPFPDAHTSSIGKQPDKGTVGTRERAELYYRTKGARKGYFYPFPPILIQIKCHAFLSFSYKPLVSYIKKRKIYRILFV